MLTKFDSNFPVVDLLILYICLRVYSIGARQELESISL